MQGSERGAESIAGGAPRLVIAAFVAIALAHGCAASKTPPPAPAKLAGGAAADALAMSLDATSAPAASNALVVQLVFDGSADLDLYVTDPLTETVYFANTPTKSGGALEADRTCDDPPRRIETVVFERPLAGRYRVGVDHIRSCGPAAPAPFAVRAMSGERRVEATGALPLGRFDPIVLELDLP